MVVAGKTPAANRCKRARGPTSMAPRNDMLLQEKRFSALRVHVTADLDPHIRLGRMAITLKRPLKGMVGTPTPSLVHLFGQPTLA